MIRKSGHKPQLLAYTAGIIDGEGCIFLSHIRRKNGNIQYCIRVTVSDTNEWLIHWLHFNFGGHILLKKSAGKGGDKCKPQWQSWQLSNCGYSLFVPEKAASGNGSADLEALCLRCHAARHGQVIVLEDDGDY